MVLTAETRRRRGVIWVFLWEGAEVGGLIESGSRKGCFH
jgi:hypothetical protein